MISLREFILLESKYEMMDISIKNIFKEGELRRESVVAKYL